MNIRRLLIIVVTLHVAVTYPFAEEQWIQESEKAHGMKAWWETKAVEAYVTYANKKGKSPDSGYFYFEAHGPRVLYKEKGKTLIFDGEKAWGWPKEKIETKDRFHLLTWPWFIIQPFKMRGTGSQLSDYRAMSINNNHYQTALQTFEANVGDTPDDWYRLLIDPQSKILKGVGYIVTFFRPKAEAEKKPSVLFYKNYQDIQGVKIAKEWELWYWDGNEKVIGGNPKSTGRVEGLKLFDKVDSTKFAIPENAIEVKLP